AGTARGVDAGEAERASRGGVHPAGAQPGGGNRYPNAPAIIAVKYTAPRTTKVCHTPTDAGVEKRRISRSASGVPIIAPPPNPMMASPVAMPRRSGNHLISVDTGEM